MTKTATDSSASNLTQSLREQLRRGLGRPEAIASRHDVYSALATVVREQMFDRFVAGLERYGGANARRVAYLSAEFLPGPHLANNLFILGLTGAARAAVAKLGFELDDILEQEEEPGLGNGGLGRLASCYLDSLATLDVPAVGYGIRYEFGIFDQVLRGGWQCEITDKWLRFGNPWEIIRPDIAHIVRFGGHTEHHATDDGRLRVRWVPHDAVKGVACDTPIAGHGSGTCNILRLWKAEAVESFDLAAFNHGDYYRAVEDKVESETITKILYPNDENHRGKLLRLKQQYFFCTCSLQDMLRIHTLLGGTPATFHEKWAVQLNDTHPAVSVAELMRLLVDVHGLDWEPAWDVTRATFAYTNHTLLPEALERWPVDLFRSLLPRHLEIIYEINRRFLEEVRARFPGDDARVARLSLIDETGPRYVRMAHLACVGSHAVNGVARLHSDLLRRTVLRDFADLWPDRFHNITNGVTPRRFVAVTNPGLAQLLDEVAGGAWPRDLTRLRALEPLANDAAFRRRWRDVKLANKCHLAALVEHRTGIRIAPESLLDVQAKRIHEYKRQHLAALHILTLYLRIKSDPAAVVPPRTFLFGGKAAPGYRLAKCMIRLITAAAETINADPAVNGRLRVVFLPDYNVKTAHLVYPAADLSEQISLAGCEASGTGNMKFSLNGALTIGTLDGANVEIREAVGPENFFLFGLTADEVAATRAAGHHPRARYDADPTLRAVLDFIASGALCGGDASVLAPLVDNLVNHDPFLVLADYAAYIAAQEQVSALWLDPEEWTRRAILNVARMSGFSSDRSIADYCRLIWNITPGAPADSA